MISNEIIRLQTAKANIKSAIEAKGVTVPSATTIDGYATLVGQIQTGATEAPDNDVNFYDYDGFRVASFTIAEAKALTQAEYDAILPPAHSGLTFQEWNWTLNDITTYNRQYIDIGANYITTDGNTHIRADVNAGKHVVLKLQARDRTLLLYWGDGSNETHTYNSSANEIYAFEHTYQNSGSYNISVQTDNSGIYSYFIVNGVDSDLYWIKEINFGNKTSLCINYSLGFLDCIVSIPKGTDASIIRGTWMSHIPQLNIPNNNSNFRGYFTLQYLTGCVSLPRSVSAFNSAAMAYSNVTKIVVPESVVSSGTPLLNSGALSNMRYCRIISMPDIQFATLASGQFFQNDSSLQELDVVQGYIPTQNMVLSASSQWTADTMVKLFTKLGTTTNAITLTFGSANLDKLTADQKAIATNKGYTLA